MLITDWRRLSGIVNSIIYRHILERKLRVLYYALIVFIVALLVSVIFSERYDGSQAPLRGRARRKSREFAAGELSSSQVEEEEVPTLKDPYANRPRIRTRNGHLVIEASQDKNIEFKTSGARGSVKINGLKLDQLMDITRALERSNAAKGSTAGGASSGGSEGSGENQFEWLFRSSARLAALEQKVEQHEKEKLVLMEKVSTLGKKLSKSLQQVSKLNELQVNASKALARNECQLAGESGAASLSRCKNGGTCISTFRGFQCLCPSNWAGPSCEEDVDECARFKNTDLGCQNGGRCVNFPGGYRCECATSGPTGNLFHGIHCTERHDDCALSSSRALCGEGKCVSVGVASGGGESPPASRYECICNQGWTTDGRSPACSLDVNECALFTEATGGNSSSQSPQQVTASNFAYPCSQSPFVECTNLPGSFRCAACPAGYSGDGRVCRDIDECQVNNGGCSLSPLVECTNLPGGHKCGPCPPGFVSAGSAGPSGSSLVRGVCRPVGPCSLEANGGCHPRAVCHELSDQKRLCLCLYPFSGAGLGPSGCSFPPGPTRPSGDQQQSSGNESSSSGASAECAMEPCLHGAICVDRAQYLQDGSPTFECLCQPGWIGRLCEHRADFCKAGDLYGWRGTLSFPPVNILNGTEPLMRETGWQELGGGGGGSSRTGKLGCGWQISTRRGKALEMRLSRLSNWRGLQVFRKTAPENRYRSAPICPEWLDIHELREPRGVQAGAGLPGSADDAENSKRSLYEPSLLARFCANKAASSVSVAPFMNSRPEKEPILVRAESGRARLEYWTTSGRSAAAAAAAASTQTGSGLEGVAINFTLDWSSASPNCGAELEKVESGWLSSPLFPSAYPEGSECRYLLRASQNRRLRLSFKYLNLRVPPSYSLSLPTSSNSNSNSNKQPCSDSLVVLEGAMDSPNRQVLFEYCANQNGQFIWNGSVVSITPSSSRAKDGPNKQLASLIVSSGEALEIVLISSADSVLPPERAIGQQSVNSWQQLPSSVLRGVGFELHYSSEPATFGCGRLLSALSGFIQSSDFLKVPNLSPFEAEPPLLPWQVLSDPVDTWNMSAFSVPPGGASISPATPTLASLPASAASWQQQQQQGSSGRIRCEYEIQPTKSLPAHRLRIDSLEMPGSNQFGYPPAGYLSRSSKWSRKIHCARASLRIYEADSPSDVSSHNELAHFCSGDFYNATLGADLYPAIIAPGHHLYLLYESAYSSSELGLASTGFRLHYSTICRSVLREPVGRFSVSLSSELPECLYELALPANQTISLMVEASSLRVPESCRARAIFMDGAVPALAQRTLDSAQRLLRQFDSLQQLQQGAELASAPTNRAGDSAGLLGADLRDPPGLSRRDSSPPPDSAESSLTAVDNSYWQYSRSDAHDIKEFSVCLLPKLSFHSLWNQLTLLFKLDETEAGAPSRMSVQSREDPVIFTVRYQAEPACGGIISEPAEGRVRLLETSHTSSKQVVGRTPSAGSQLACAWVLRAPNPRQLVRVKFEVGAAGEREIRARLKDWLARSASSRLALKSAGGNKSSLVNNPAELGGDFQCSDLFLESIELFEPTLNLSRFICPKDLVETLSSTEASTVENTSLDGWLLSQSSSVLIRLHNNTQQQPLASPTNLSSSSSSSSTSKPPLLAQPKPLPKTFSFNYTFIESRERLNCGGKLIQNSGVIWSPNFPFYYPPKADCVWLIEANPRQQVRLNFTFFDVELSFRLNCYNDYLEIRNGPSQSSPLLGRFCGDQLQSRIIISHSNLVRLRFVSDRRISRAGFEIRFDGAQTGCGGTLNSESGLIESPNYPLPFTHSANCEWLIELAQGNRIQLTIHNVDLNLCNSTALGQQNLSILMADYLAIYDSGKEILGNAGEGVSFSLKPLAKLCKLPTRNSSFVLPLSTSNKMLLVYKSKALDEGRGFQVSYRTVCNNVELVGFQGAIESPGFPTGYLTGSTCSWIIRAPLGSNLSVALTSLDLNKHPMRINKNKKYTRLPADQLTVSSMNSNKEYKVVRNFSGKLEQLEETSRIFELNSNVGLVNFSSEGLASEETGGFRLEWQAKGCGGAQTQGEAIHRVVYHELSTKIPVECLWTYDFSRSANAIDISLQSDMRIPAGNTRAATNSCDDASLTIFDGLTDRAPVLFRNCDSQRSRETIHSSTGKALVRFYSSGKHPSYGRSFNLIGWALSRSNCLSSVYELTSPYNKIAGEMKSPNYPDLFDPASVKRCFALLSTQTGRLKIKLEDLDIPVSPTTSEESGDSSAAVAVKNLRVDRETCKKAGSYLVIKDITGQKVDEIFCGRMNSEAAGNELVIEQESVWIEFHSSKSSYPGKWKLNYSRLCGLHVYLDYSHTFVTSDYPDAPAWSQTTEPSSSYDPSRAEDVCIWRLRARAQGEENESAESATVAAGNRIHLNIVNFVQSTRKNAPDCLRVYEGTDISLKQSTFNLTDIDLKYRPIIKICSIKDIKHSSLQFVSSGNELIVLVSGQTRVKFKAKKSSTFCGGEFHLSEAELGSPNYPAPYGSNLDCHYFIAAAPGSRINLKFIDFNLPLPMSLLTSIELEDSNPFIDASSNYTSTTFDETKNVDSLNEELINSLSCDNLDYLEIRQLSVVDRINLKRTQLTKKIMYKWSQDALMISDSPSSSSYDEIIGKTFTTLNNNTKEKGVSNNSSSSSWTDSLDLGANKSEDRAARYYIELVRTARMYDDTSSRFGMAAASKSAISLDDFYEGSKLIGRYCGKTKINYLNNLILQDEILLRFRSHDTTKVLPDQAAARGFLAQYSFTYGGAVTLIDEKSKSEGYISSPSFPTKLQYNNSIQWTFQTTEDSVIKFQLISMDLGSIHEDCTDSLSIYDGLTARDTLMQRLCGHLSFKSPEIDKKYASNMNVNHIHKMVPIYLAHDEKVQEGLIKSVRSTSNTASIIYDNYKAKGSFMLRYEAVSKRSLLEANESTVFFKNEFWPPPAVNSSSAIVNNQQVYFGEESYQVQQEDTKKNVSNLCSFTHLLSEGKPAFSEIILSSPKWPKEPPHNIECHWLVYTLDNTNIQLSVVPAPLDLNQDPSETSNDISQDVDLFGGGTERRSDHCLDLNKNEKRNFIVIYDGASRFSPVLARHCLPVAPIHFQSTGRHMLIRYVHSEPERSSSKGSVSLSKSLFRGVASVGLCGGQHHILSSSRIYDRQLGKEKTYGNNLNCRYYLFAAGVDKVLVFHNEMSEFNLASEPTNADCSVGDYIEIRDLPIRTDLLDYSRSNSGRLLGRFCAGHKLEYFETPGSAVTIDFKTDSENTATGWQIFVMSSAPRLSCPRGYVPLNLDESYGRISSPGFPDGFEGKRKCRFNLVAPLNQTIELTFIRLNRPELANSGADSNKCKDSLVYLPDNEASTLRFVTSPLAEVQAPFSGTLLRKLVKKVPCKAAGSDELPVDKLSSDGQREVRAFRKLSAEEYFAYQQMANNASFTIKTDSHILLLEYEAANLQANEGFFAIFKLIDKNSWNQCGGDIYYKSDINNNNNNNNTSSSARHVNLIKSGKFGGESRESDSYIQCDWNLHNEGSSFDYFDMFRQAISYNLAPSSKIGDFKTVYLIFQTLEIPMEISSAENWLFTDKVKKSNELCGLTRLMVTDSYNTDSFFLCGNVTNEHRWLILDYNVRHLSLRTKNLRKEPTANSPESVYWGLKAYFYEKTCLQLERLVGEGVRFRSHQSYPNTSYSPGICKWDLLLNGGDYELWFESINLRPPKNVINSTSNEIPCDEKDTSLDHIELRASAEGDSPVIKRFCYYNQLVNKQKALILNMRSELSIVFVAGINRLLEGSEKFSSDGSSDNGNQAGVGEFGFNMVLVKTRNESEGAFCRRDSHDNVYNFIKPAEKEYFSYSFSSLSNQQATFLYPKNTHCIVELSLDTGMRYNMSFKGIFDLEASKDCSGDYVQVDDLFLFNKTSNALDLNQITQKAKNNNDLAKLTIINHREYYPKLIGKWCGRNKPNGFFLSKSEKIRITFHSNEYIEGKGFNLEYTTFNSLMNETGLERSIN